MKRTACGILITCLAGCSIVTAPVRIASTAVDVATTTISTAATVTETAVDIATKAPASEEEKVTKETIQNK